MATPTSRMGSSYIPGGYDDIYFNPPAATPELLSPEPQRHMPEMSSQIQHGLQNMTLNHRESTASSITADSQHEILNNTHIDIETPRFSHFPKLNSPPANVPPSDDEFEETLWNARNLVLDSSDPEMQLAWAADALIYVGTSADNEERVAAAKPASARSNTPRIEHELKHDAMNIVTFLSTQHHPKAEFLKGMWLEWGRFGEREDKKEAFRCYSRAADKGYARAEYRIGMLYESFNDATKALRHYHRGVDAGDSASCYRLGMMTLRGQHGQQQDWRRGVDLIRQSAETADENAAQGAYVYGMLLARQLPQISVPEEYLQLDEAKARMYIEKAAFLKFAKAQLKMGSSYELGAMGCDFDPALSMHYYALAARQGEAEADMALSKWFLVGHEGSFSKNEELSFTYAERAAATGLATAEFALGYFYEIGMSVTVDVHKSMEWYEKASMHGNEDAKARIDALSKRQYLSKKDHEVVAINRIKSMHNSMRGPRPERRPVQSARLGQISETPGTNFPPRAASAVPYPVDDRPPVVAGARPGSTVPYPVHEQAPTSYNTPNGRDWLAPQQVPRPATTTYIDHRPYQQQARPAYGSPSLQPQPQFDRRYPQGHALPPAGSPLPAMHHPQGRGGQPQQRIVSSPSHLQGSFPSQGSPRPGQYPPSAPGTPYQQPLQQAQPVSIGFSAPFVDRRPRLSGNSQQSRPTQGRPPPSTMQQSQSVPNMNQMRPPPKSTTPQSTAPRPPSKDPKPAVGSAPVQPKPPKAGPQTFEEMGVQAKKNGEDCVVM